jgi:hypothetical protein
MLCIFCAVILYTQIYLQLTAQYMILMVLHVLAMNLTHLEGTAVLEDTCSMLCNLSAVNFDSLFTADKLHNTLHESLSTVGHWRWLQFMANHVAASKLYTVQLVVNTFVSSISCCYDHVQMCSWIYIEIGLCTIENMPLEHQWYIVLTDLVQSALWVHCWIQALKAFNIYFSPT